MALQDEGLGRGALKHTRNKEVKIMGNTEHLMKMDKDGYSYQIPNTETTYSLPITISTLETIIEAIESQAAKYRETVEDLKTMEGVMVDG